MQMKIFHHRIQWKLEEEVNDWLKDNPVQFVSSQMNTVLIEDVSGYWLESVIVLFYIPMEQVGR